MNCIALLTLQLIVGAIVAADGLDLTGSWIGRYEYDKKTDLPNGEVMMILLSESDGKSFSGRHYEANNWGEKDNFRIDSVTLEANVLGVTDSPNHITFIHKYDGRGGQKHTLKYVGVVSDDQKAITGKWYVGDEWSGTFVFEKVDFSKIKMPAAVPPEP